MENASPKKTVRKKRKTHTTRGYRKREQEVQNLLKKYYAAFEQKDRLRLTRASKELLEKRSQLRETFMEYRNKRIAEWVDQKSRRVMLRGRKYFVEYIFPRTLYLA